MGPARQDRWRQAFGLNRPGRPHPNADRWLLQEVAGVAELPKAGQGFLPEVPDANRCSRLALDGKTLRGRLAHGEQTGLHRLGGMCLGAG